MNEIHFTDTPPVMDPDKPVRCLWYVMFQMRGWNGDLYEGVNSQGPYEDKSDAEKMGAIQRQYGHHILAIVPAIFQDGDYIEGYTPYEKPKPEPTRRDVYGSYYLGGNEVIERVILPGRPIEHIDFELNRAVFEDFLGPRRAPDVVVPVVEPGDGIAKALEAKNAGIRRSAQIGHGLPARDTTHRALRRESKAPIHVSSKSWTGRKR